MTEIGYRATAGIGGFIPVTVGHSYSTKLSLAMHKNIGVTGMASWVDMTAEFDTLKTSFKIEMLNSSDDLLSFENFLKMRNVYGANDESESLVIRFADGFYPLSTMYKGNYITGDTATDNQYDLAVTNKPQPTAINYSTDAVQYSFDVVPLGTELIPATPFASCQTYSGWTLDGLSLPYPESQPNGKLNSNSSAQQLNKGATLPYRYGNEYGETVDIAVEVSEETARQLLLKLSTIRGSKFTLIAPQSYRFFGNLYPSNTNFECILNDNVIEISTSNHNNITIKFSIQMQAVL